MTPEGTLALQIAAIGMALVFAAILLLWGGMSLLARVTAPRSVPPVRAANEDARLRAAAAAVALATVRARQVRAFPMPPTALVSAWQAVMRSAQLRQRGPVR